MIRKRFWLVLCSLVLLAVASPNGVLAGGARHAGALSWNAYWKQVEDTRQAVLECEQIPPEQVRDRLEALIAQWESVTAIDLPDGREIAVDQSYLISLLKVDSPDLESIDKLLTVMLAERDLVQARPGSADQEALLDHILSQPEFQWKEQNSQPGMLEKLWQRVQEELNKIGQNLLGFKGANYVIAIGAVILFCVMLLFLFRNLLVTFVAESQLAPHSRAGNEELTADTALQRAQDLSRGGDYRSAVRYLYLSALLLLEERGLLRYDRTKTNREYLRSVSGFPELEAPLRAVVDVFDRVWYGFQPLEEPDYQFYERQVGKLRQQRSAVQQKRDGV